MLLHFVSNFGTSIFCGLMAILFVQSVKPHRIPFVNTFFRRVSFTLAIVAYIPLPVPDQWVLRSIYKTALPSTLMTAPFTKLASSDAKKRYTFATSSTVPRRFAGTFSFHPLVIFSGMDAIISVAIKPGAIALTVISLTPQLSGPHFCHSDDTRF